MIQATNSHIRRLFNEKVQAEEELQECKERIQNQIQTVIQQREYSKPYIVWNCIGLNMMIVLKGPFYPYKVYLVLFWTDHVKGNVCK